MKIVLIPCSAKKLDYRAPARELYCSHNFRKLLRIAELQNADVILVLSALHHVVDLDRELDPYDCTLIRAPRRVKEEWAESVTEQLSSRFNLKEDEFIIYTPNDYNLFINEIKHKTLPLEGLTQGRRAQRINEMLSELLTMQEDQNERVPGTS